jgi:hypothetical protein
MYTRFKKKSLLYLFMVYIITPAILKRCATRGDYVRREKVYFNKEKKPICTEIFIPSLNILIYF